MWLAISPKVIKFVSQRRKPRGGYGATPLLPATIEDTYFALRILNLLSCAIDVPDFLLSWDGLKVYLSGELNKEFKNARTMYQIIWSMKVARLKIDYQVIFDFFKKRQQETRNIEELYYLLRIKKDFLADQYNYSISPTGFKHTTVKTLWMWLYMNEKELSEDEKQRYSNWLKACQNPDGGFGFHPGSTSYVENSHLALLSLCHLSSRPKDPDSARHFLLASRTSPGGFARIHGGVAFLDSTWHALAGLFILQRSEKNPFKRS